MMERCGLLLQPCATQVISLMKSNMMLVLGIAFAIAVLLVSKHTQREERLVTFHCETSC